MDGRYAYWSGRASGGKIGVALEIGREPQLRGKCYSLHTWVDITPQMVHIIRRALIGSLAEGSNRALIHAHDEVCPSAGPRCAIEGSPPDVIAMRFTCNSVRPCRQQVLAYVINRVLEGYVLHTYFV